MRLSTERGRAVPGFVSAQEGIVTYVPHEPLDPGTTYVLEVLAGGQLFGFAGILLALPVAAISNDLKRVSVPISSATTTSSVGCSDSLERGGASPVSAPITPV